MSNVTDRPRIDDSKKLVAHGIGVHTLNGILEIDLLADKTLRFIDDQNVLLYLNKITNKDVANALLLRSTNYITKYEDIIGISEDPLLGEVYYDGSDFTNMLISEKIKMLWNRTMKQIDSFSEQVKNQILNRNEPTRPAFNHARFLTILKDMQALNTIHSWEGLPGGNDFLASAEIQNLSLVEKAAKFDDWLEAHKEVYEIEDLNLSDKNLTMLPTAFNKFVNLKILSLSNNQLQIVPDLPNTLQSLKISNNCLIKLPELNHLNNLSILSAAHNKLNELPSLPVNLEYLDTSNNNLSVLPDFPANLWVSINVSNNNLTVLPPLPVVLEHLEASNNNLIVLPPLLTDFLRYLDISNNQLTELQQLPADLRYLDISNNQLTKLQHLPADLRYLDISNNQLTELQHLPINLEYLVNLEYLDTSNNNFHNTIFLPEQFLKLFGWSLFFYCLICYFIYYLK